MTRVHFRLAQAMTWLARVWAETNPPKGSCPSSRGGLAIAAAPEISFLRSRRLTGGRAVELVRGPGGEFPSQKPLLGNTEDTRFLGAAMGCCCR